MNSTYRSGTLDSEVIVMQPCEPDSVRMLHKIVSERVSMLVHI
ncbi:hypothetical protein [Jeotgalibacillus sp. R-1-5s-1]|nr:hypothetical protein [Jeotgalibacillus sp. R-1-5s-1]